MNWMNDLVVVLYWGSIVSVLVVALIVLVMAAYIICRAAERGPEFFHKNAVDRELRRMLNEPRR